MSNTGPTTQVLTGFPNQDYDSSPTPDLAQGVYDFTANITNFKAWTDTTTYTPSEQPVSVGQYAGEQWFVWNMTYPQGKTIPVHVSYEQLLGQQQLCDGCDPTPDVNVIYVLRTGALWAGNIDSAHITFEAPNGGGFVGADGASTLADDHVVWDFTNFKPSSDVGTIYVFATRWKEIQAAEAAAKQSGAGPTAFLRAAQDLDQLLNTDHPGGDARVSPFLAKGYASEFEQWAADASVLNTADAWTTLGDADVFASGAVVGRKGDIGCWPSNAAAAYQQAVDLGSDRAANNLSYLHGGGLEGVSGDDVEQTLPTCGS
jgi:hypothetical protein